MLIKVYILFHFTEVGKSFKYLQTRRVKTSYYLRIILHVLVYLLQVYILQQCQKVNCQHFSTYCILYMTEVFGLIFALLDVASKTLLSSQSLLSSLYKSSSKSSLVQKYIKSRHPLRIYMGPFHVVDRGRAPALIRFWLQRTMLLVVKFNI